jgi:hypothetical protein
VLAALIGGAAPAETLLSGLKTKVVAGRGRNFRKAGSKIVEVDLDLDLFLLFLSSFLSVALSVDVLSAALSGGRKGSSHRRANLWHNMRWKLA